MASSNDVVADAPSADNQEQVTKEEKPTKTSKDKKTTTSKDKKPTASKPPASHPPYTQMITEAIGALKERTGSSPHAIAKFLSEKYKSDLPPTFKKHINLQLKNMVKLGKVVKVKGSFKLPKPAGSSTASTKPKKAPAAKAPAKEKAAKPAAKAPAKESKVAAPAAKKAEKPAPKKASMTKKAPGAKKTTATKKSASAPKKVAAPKKAGSAKKS